MKTQSSGGEFTIAPAGMHVGRCFKIIDLGTQHNDAWDKYQRRVLVFFELPNAPFTYKDHNDREVTNPFIVNKRYTLSHDDRSWLRKDLESWYGKKFSDKQLDDAGGFDMAKLLDKPALLNVAHSDDGKWANIIAINPLIQGTECPARVNDLFMFDLDAFDQAKFDSMSDGLKNVVMKSKEWAARIGPSAAETSENIGDATPGDIPPPDEFDDEIPF